MAIDLHPNIPNLLVLIAPKNFGYNPETAASNGFQNQLELKDINDKVLEELNSVLEIFDTNKIGYRCFEDIDEVLPDAIFPNNWFSHAPDGRLTIYPMLAENRQKEVRFDILDWIKKEVDVSEIIDLRNAAEAHEFLEGTGSIIFDHQNKLAFACESPRTSIALFERYCNLIGYEAISFEAVDLKGKPIYHTNVLMTLTNQLCIVNLEAFPSVLERAFFRHKIESTGRSILEIDYAQMNHFLANSFEVQNKEGVVFLVMSETAFESLNQKQLEILTEKLKLLVVDVSTIEKVGGGGIRCMLAGIFNSGTKQNQI